MPESVVVRLPAHFAMSQTRPKHPASSAIVASWRVMPPSAAGWKPPASSPSFGSPGVCVQLGFGSQTFAQAAEGSDCTRMPPVVSDTPGSDLVTMVLPTQGPQEPAVQVELPREHVT